MNEINSIESLVYAYQNGQRHFSGIDIETGETLKTTDLSGSTFEDCFFFLDSIGLILRNVSFQSCNLKTCSFKDSDLTNAKIHDCALESLSFDNCVMNDFSFENNSCYSFIVGQKDLDNFIND